MDELKDYYYDISKPGAFSGQQQFLRSLKSQRIEHDSKQVTEWLKKQEPYSLHRPLKKIFKRNRVIVPGIDDTWQIDLVDMRKFAKLNRGNHYILTIIDVFSKFAWAVPVHRKTGNFTTKAFKQVLFNSKRCPKKIQFDKGNEFLNSSFKKLLTENLGFIMRTSISSLANSSRSHAPLFLTLIANGGAKLSCVLLYTRPSSITSLISLLSV